MLHYLSYRSGLGGGVCRTQEDGSKVGCIKCPGSWTQTLSGSALPTVSSLSSYPGLGVWGNASKL